MRQGVGLSELQIFEQKPAHMQRIRTTPHHVDIGPDEWFCSLVMVLMGVVLVGVVLGIVVLPGKSCALFLSGGELSPVGSCPRTDIQTEPVLVSGIH